MPTITGTASDDVLVGTSGEDVINGLAGRDTITGGLGADWLIGIESQNDARDTFVYLSVADSPRGGAIDVISLGRSAEDLIDFSALTVTSVTLSHVGQTSNGSSSSAYLTVQTPTGDLQIFMTTTSSLLGLPLAYTGPVTVVGSGLANFLVGGPGNDVLYGNDGDDGLLGLGGSNLFYGGAGRDTYYFNAFDSSPGDFNIIADFEQGQDTINLGGSSGNFSIVRLANGGSLAFSLRANGGLVTVGVPGIALNGSDITSNSFLGLDIIGSSLHETIVGSNSGGGLLKGEGGNDTLRGGDLADTIIGGAGFDALFGGGGNDIFVYANRLDSTLAEADIIFDFVSGREKIDLTAVRTGANDKFGIAYLGTGSFLFVDLGGEGTYDMLIQLANTHLLASDITWGTANGTLEETAKSNPPEVLPVEDDVCGISGQTGRVMLDLDPAISSGFYHGQDWYL